MATHYFRITLLVLSFQIIQETYAAPIDPIGGESISRSQAYEILKTIVLGYLTHIMTIRPTSDTDQMNTLYWRATFFVYPTIGIGTAFKAIFIAYDGDKILGIDEADKYIKEIDENKKQHWIEAWASDCWLPLKEFFLSKFSTPGSKYDSSGNRTEEKESSRDDFRTKAAELRDKIKKEAEKDKDYTHRPGDNVFYLAAILHLMKPRQARRAKHCILNSSIYLGLEANEAQVEKYKDNIIPSQNMRITGTGIESTYQAGIKPFTVRYLSEKMLDQIHTAYYLDATSYTEICITIGQLVYTVIECIDTQGDRWAKVIMIIYMTMSVLQTVSLWCLHKQISALTILYDEDINIVIYEIGDLPSESDILNPDLYDKEDVIGIQTRIGNIRNRMPNSYYMSSHEDTSSNREEDTPPKNSGPPQENSKPPTILYEGSFLEKIIQKEKIINNNGYKTYIEYHTYSYITAGCGGMTLSLLAGIWAGYNVHSVTQWLVLAWILSPVLLVPMFYLKNRLKIRKKPKLVIILWGIVYIFGFIGAGCVLAATILGYVLHK
ncbi:hypothetical protein J3Q64DRAFT_1725569 [Phycomyces blakesleeanus]|uniref:Uncharacterized protein n=1 Tax=Phycomyces blakesleeanus TaxID=4837 RepID=A0ABR3B791_PHYBL